MDDLWHYTCWHRARMIGRRGVLVPHPQPFLSDRALVWLTDLDQPDVEALGLTMGTVVQCDRTEVRYRVTHGDVLPWATWVAAARVERTDVSALTFGRRPRHWFVATAPVAVERG